MLAIRAAHCLEWLSLAPPSQVWCRRVSDANRCRVENCRRTSVMLPSSTTLTASHLMTFRTRRKGIGNWGGHPYYWCSSSRLVGLDNPITERIWRAEPLKNKVFFSSPFSPLCRAQMYRQKLKHLVALYIGPAPLIRFHTPMTIRPPSIANFFLRLTQQSRSRNCRPTNRWPGKSCSTCRCLFHHTTMWHTQKKRK